MSHSASAISPGPRFHPTSPILSYDATDHQRGLHNLYSIDPTSTLIAVSATRKYALTMSPTINQNLPQDQVDSPPPVCQFCHEHINEKTIFCGKCRQPYHEHCANSITPQESPWVCPLCSSKKQRSRNSSISSISSSTSLTSKQKLELKKLEEERQLKEKRDREYLERKYSILQQIDEETTNNFQEILQENIPDQNNTPIAENTTMQEPINDLPNIISNTSIIPHTSNFNPVTSAAVHQSLLNQDNTHNSSHPFQFIPNTTSMQSTANINLNTNPQPLDGTNNQSFINPEQARGFQEYIQQQQPRRRNLTQEQLYARQTVPKELPIFSGNPEEWPLFSSTFDWSTAVCGLTDAENLIRLQRSLRGSALESVEKILIHPTCVPHAISTLKVLFGQPEKIVFSLKNKIKSLPQVNPNKMETITNFAVHVKGLLSTIEACGLTDEINNTTLMHELVSKLPPYYQLHWGTQKLYLQQNNVKANLVEFSNWIFDLGLSASTVNNESNVSSDISSNRKQRNVHIHSHTKTNKKKCIICSEECQNVPNCKKFLSADRKERWNMVNVFALCRHCLRKHSGSCYNKEKVCNVDSCQFKHHYLLHGSKTNTGNTVQLAQNRENKNNSSEREQENAIEENLQTHNNHRQNILFKVVPITIYGDNNNNISTFAFLDDGSSISLIDEGILNQLGLKGEPEQLCLKWTSNVKRMENNSQRLNIRVRGGNSKEFVLEVRSVEELLLPKQSLDYKTISSRFSHLKGIPVESYNNAVPKVLIGLDNINVLTSSKSKGGKSNEPIGIKTKLGWTIYGPCENVRAQHYNFHMCDCSERDNKLHEMVKDFYRIENIGVSCSKIPSNKNDERALQLLEKYTTQREDGHYETCLLWQYDNIKLPSNYDMALKRLVCLERKLLADKVLHSTFQDIISDYINKGFISKIENSESCGNVWYLPIFPVFNKNKPGKCRIVWDAAAKYNGISLNTMLYKGPDFLSSLPAILFKFREKSVALCGDVEQMFHQVYIRNEDRQVQRFLWRNCNVEKEPDIYVMNVMIFGASCAPCISQYVKNKNASKFINKLPEASSAVIENHYVDDFLYSTDTVDQAVQIAKQVQYIQRQAGFNLRNWTSNKSDVISCLGNSSESDKPLDIGPDEQTEKVLGIFWNPKNDFFIFKISPHIRNNEVIQGNKPATKRQILKILMTIFDPLGLIGNFLMYLKILLQEIWRSGVSWDEPIKDDQLVKWRKWLQYLPDLETIKIPRCYLKSLGNYNNTNLQLHTFVDASENGYAAVAYLRIEFNNQIICSIVGSKTRVAPLRMNSIPRLELMAALIALRVGEILESSDLHEWFWIPGKLNVADEATKWAKRPDLTEQSRWFNGPPFLLKSECEWPKSEFIPEPTAMETNQVVLKHEENTSFIDIKRFSKWTRAVRCVAYVIRFILILKTKRKDYGEFTSAELERAEMVLYRQAQNEFYSEEIYALKSNMTLPKSSPLYKATPKLEDNILRVDGRIENALVSANTKNPIILPKNSYVTYLLILHYHSKYHHGNNETVVNEIRQQWYIPKLRTVVKKLSKLCQHCKIKTTKPSYPQMAKLPTARLASFSRPFTYTGVDYFGPLMISVGRHQEKRYGALFTCLTLRAVHIEVVNTLNTSSCLLAIRNFICRRGTPKEFYSDNGTNFVSAEKELREAIKEVNKDELVRNFTTSVTKWNFIPPSSPHMGGAWERMVRSVKNILYKIAPTKTPSEETLRGMLAEVENIVNSRPLTYVPLDTENEEALTPNHLLLGSSNGMKPLAMYDDSGHTLKQNWLMSQQFADNFWRKWVKEYLPNLTRRSKWHEKAKPIEVGDLVVVVDPSNPRNVWPRGKVIETMLAKDGQVRKAKVLTSGGLLVRPAVKLAILDVAHN
ncbi:uncharacterized protein LOC142235399 [Haematobia irritans]|uniref:uncharacterized protein LOC142235399 n=1 Tax=Haematobia irritans TaxID=7368 RepID=UPI003F50C719